LWVTDFGLARFGADAGLTMTGDLLGTLRYMSPEQALAKHGLVDHRTDVYSLGATLYELLTLRPAIDGRDRQEVLRRIAFEEPAPPRALDRAIPADLETVTLKALAKEPGERYATAKELADDLRRFLEDQPIRAKRPTLAQRAAKWARRHHGAVLTAAALCGLAALVLGGSTAWVWQANRQKDGALVEKTEALEQKDAALAEKDQALREKDAALQKAKEEKRRADISFEKSIDLTDANGGLALTLQQSANARGAAEAYRPIVTFWEGLLAESPGDRRYLSQVARHNWNLGKLLMSQGKCTQAVAPLRRSADLETQLMPEGQPLTKPNSAKARALNLAHLLTFLGEALRDAGQFEEADQVLARSLDIWARMDQEQPVVEIWAYMKGGVHVRRGILLRERGQFKQAEAECRQALHLLATKLGGRAADLAQAHLALGDALHAGGKVEEAEKSYRVAVAAFKSPGGDALTLFGSPDDLAWLLATCPCAKVRQPDEAVKLAKQRLQPGPSEADGWLTLGTAHYYAGAYDAAVAALRQSVDRRQDVDTLDRFLLAMAYYRLDKKEDARKWYKQAVEGMDKYKPGDDRLRRFRAEAAGLLGIQDAPARDNKKTPTPKP
jgi:tetratricopeptide (TPR) repeat protein